MQQIIDAFNERVKEVELYFRFLEKLEEPNVSLYFPRKKTHRYKEIESDILKVLKANAFLIIYNLVESGVRDGILEIYRQIEGNNSTYESVRDEIREIWIKHNYRKIFNETANWDSGRKMATQLVEDAINRAIIQLDESAIPLSGNLDARQIREICSLHGIPHRSHGNAQGGNRLREVKEQRNALAHGHLSFSECGRQFTTNDLGAIKHQAVIFVRSILRSMKRYADRKQYTVTDTSNGSSH